MDPGEPRQDGFFDDGAGRHSPLRWLVGRNDEAALAYAAAIDLTDNAPEREFLRRSRQTITPG